MPATPLSQVSPSRQSPRSEIFQSDTSDEDALRASVAHLALGDAVRPYHYFMLHFTDTESQATNHAITLTPTLTQP